MDELDMLAVAALLVSLGSILLGLLLRQVIR